jgi:hypothetical protein
MAKDLSESSTLATTRDKHSPRRRMEHHGRMNKALVVDVLIAFGGLEPSVEKKASAEVGSVLNLKLLVRRAHCQQYLAAMWNQVPSARSLNGFNNLSVHVSFYFT